MIFAARLVAPSMTRRPFRISSPFWLWSRRCTWPRMIIRGLLISCATPPASSPTAASRSALTTSVCAWRRSSSCCRVAIAARVVERQPDLVGGALEQRDLFVGERIGVSPAKREGAEDAMARAYRHAYEASDPLLQDDLAGSGQEVSSLGNMTEVSHPPAQRDASDQP